MSKIDTHQDKENIALADSMGATHRLNCTQSQYVYELNGWVIWEIRGGWQSAQLTGKGASCRYVNHTPQVTLSDALVFARDN